MITTAQSRTCPTCPVKASIRWQRPEPPNRAPASHDHLQPAYLSSKQIPRAVDRANGCWVLGVGFEFAP